MVHEIKKVTKTFAGTCLASHRVLDISGCLKLNGMTPGIVNLSSSDTTSTLKPSIVDLVEDLKALTNLKGCIDTVTGECRVGQGKTTCIATFLPNPVRTNLFFCHHGLQHLTLLGKSHHLEYLEVCISYGLAYMENTTNSNKIDGLRVSEVKRVFPSLEWLELKYLPKLKSNKFHTCAHESQKLVTTYVTIGLSFTFIFLCPIK
ncbi:hypothetical protein Cgig2_018006 [Carnegiea gigantea]|uniref:Uncharacterized protein n=1 Tax=Carnegiea gigantea TaxID=171969 RepID=A0A9Q1GPJ5_9CARY|nr:hypothetical protein Cgig2_018006 [Carnegiea gigantea]